MSFEDFEEVISSAPRLLIADLVSTRPRTLRELADVTGMSIQGVLKHLSRLKALGVIQERRIKGTSLGVRKVFFTERFHIGDFSVGDLSVVKVSRAQPSIPARTKSVYSELESLAEETLVQRRRIREHVRRLGRMIDEIIEDEIRLSTLVESLPLEDDDKLILHVIFTEEGLEQAERLLTERYGLNDARSAIDGALRRVRGFAR
jgi:DNA-binding transcriptional regulator GbsR (MarR family)